MTDLAAAPPMLRYALVQRVLHWAVAILVMLSLIGGAFLWAFGFQGLTETFGQGLSNLIYKYHKTSGVLILGLMAVRLALRLGLGAPAPAPIAGPMGALKRRAAQATHGLLYALIFAMAAVGWLATGAGGFPVEFFEMSLPKILDKDPALSGTLFAIHGWLGLAILLVVAVHVGAALHHWRVLRDGVMRRISLP